MNHFLNKKRRKYTSIIVLLCVLFGNIREPLYKLTKAAEDTSDWVISDDTGKEVDGTKIYWMKTHHAGTVGQPSYRTLFYRMSRKAFHTDEKFTEGDNSAITSFEISVKIKPVGDDTDDEKRREYSFPRDTFINVATKDLKITAQDVRNGNANVYLNPVFQRFIVINDKEHIQENAKYVFGYLEMYRLGWGGDTNSNLPGFYNIKFTITAANLFNVKVVAVDTNNNSLSGAVNTIGTVIDNPLEYSELIVNQQYTYPKTVDPTLTKSKTNYKYMHYLYEYTDRDGVFRSSGNFDSKKVSVSSPDVKPGTTLKIKLVYEPVEPENYWVNAIAVDTEGNRIMELQENKEVKFEEIFTFKVGTSRYTLNNKYTYKKEYYLKYINRDPKKDIITTMQPGPDIIYKMPDAKEAVQATFCLVYDIGPVPSIPPTPTPIGPTPTPGLPTPTPYIPPMVTPMPAVEYSKFTDVVNTGVIRADVRGGEKFVAQLGVATTESLFGEVAAKEYLLGYHFVKKVGIEYYTVKVKKNYILSWKTATPVSAGGGKTVTETVTREREVTVPREYGYWEIENLECYKIDNAVLRNFALPGGSVTIYPDYSYYSPPSVTYYHNESKDYHILPPKEKEEGITLPTQTLSNPADPTRKPTIPMEQFYSDANYKALTQTGKIKVRSDSLVFNGREVMSGGIVEREAPDVDTSAIPQCYSYIDSNVLYKNNQIIEATKKNGTYPSSGTITYTSIARVSSAKPDKPQYNIDGINTVVIHTPVICNPSITADNDKYVQLLKPTKDCVQLVLDPDPALSDFTVKISNIGFHSGKQGYFTRDFSYTLRDASLSYIASTSGLLRNEVKFPFDVYVDIGNDKLQTNDDYIKAGTWIVVGRASPRFYLPAWTKEGTYRVNFRTIAVNGVDHINQDEVFANTQLSNYVATESVDVEVSGRMYGLTVYDISDYPMWEEAFRVPNSNDLKKNVSSYPKGTDKTNYNKLYSYTYSVGTNNQYGIDTGRNIKYTFPLVNGSHPFYKNQGILKTGYLVRFSLDTIGSMFSDVCSVLIKPSFYFVDKDGKNRKAVDLYYAESINGKSKHRVKVGGALDQTNIKKVMTGDLNLGIPTTELSQTAALRGIRYGDFIANREVMFNFSDIRLNYAFRTYVGQDYAAKVKALSSYGDVLSSGITQEDSSKTMQRWYGQYYVPNEVHAVAKDFDVMDYADKYGVDYGEDFWLTDGYIIVNFSIETLDESRSRRLSYTNALNYLNNGNCSMWIMEGPALSKASYKGPTFNFYAGDFIVYYANKRMRQDYITGAIY